jgi:hypothetical protein
MKTLKELADLGAAAAFAIDHFHAYYMSVSEKSHSWTPDEPARQAFAAAVRDAVLADLVTKTDSSPVTKTVPLDMDDIRATDEFRHKASHIVETADHWNCEEVKLSWSDSPTYEVLSTNYLRRQHDSDEWKPCTKEITLP